MITTLLYRAFHGCVGYDSARNWREFGFSSLLFCLDTFFSTRSYMYFIHSQYPHFDLNPDLAQSTLTVDLPGYVYLLMGVLIGSAVAPSFGTVVWQKMNGKVNHANSTLLIYYTPPIPQYFTPHPTAFGPQPLPHIRRLQCARLWVGSSVLSSPGSPSPRLSMTGLSTSLLQDRFSHRSFMT
jgi:hypothetical protein